MAVVAAQADRKFATKRSERRGTPTVNAVVISLDAELGWGFHHRSPLPADRIETARENWRRLLALFEEYTIPATWAVVGHLFRSECTEQHVDHPAGPRCCTTEGARLGTEDIWFANGLVEAIRDGDPRHEIGLHGFTHVGFEHDPVDRAFAAAELENALAASTGRGFAPDSFVFPVNEVAHRDVLAEYDVRCYRGRCPSPPGRREKLLDALRDRGAPPIVEPVVDEHGMVNVPASANLFAFEGWARSLVEPFRGDPVENRVGRGLDRLADREGICHLWFHPHDLTRERKFERLEAVLTAIAEGRERGTFQVETMGGVAERVLDDDGNRESALDAHQRRDSQSPISHG